MHQFIVFLVILFFVYGAQGQNGHGFNIPDKLLGGPEHSDSLTRVNSVPGVMPDGHAISKFNALFGQKQPVLVRVTGPNTIQNMKHMMLSQPVGFDSNEKPCENAVPSTLELSQAAPSDSVVDGMLGGPQRWQEHGFRSGGYRLPSDQGNVDQNSNLLMPKENDFSNAHNPNNLPPIVGQNIMMNQIFLVNARPKQMFMNQGIQENSITSVQPGQDRITIPITNQKNESRRRKMNNRQITTNTNILQPEQDIPNSTTPSLIHHTQENITQNSGNNQTKNTMYKHDTMGSKSNISAIPGIADVDYPIYSTIPKTTFRCENHEYPGYYADPEGRCQVFHICLKNRKFDFLCPNGTIFSQALLVCVWWNQFDCSSATSLYKTNANVYKAMLDKTPKQLESKPMIPNQTGLITTTSESSTTTPSSPLNQHIPVASIQIPKIQNMIKPFSNEQTFNNPTKITHFSVPKGFSESKENQLATIESVKTNPRHEKLYSYKMGSQKSENIKRISRASTSGKNNASVISKRQKVASTMKRKPAKKYSRI